MYFEARPSISVISSERSEDTFSLRNLLRWDWSLFVRLRWKSFIDSESLSLILPLAREKLEYRRLLSRRRRSDALSFPLLQGANLRNSAVLGSRRRFRRSRSLWLPEWVILLLVAVRLLSGRARVGCSRKDKSPAPASRS